MEETYEYYCTYCSEPQPHMEVASACHLWGEYKGIVEVGPAQTIEGEQK